MSTPTAATGPTLDLAVVRARAAQVSRAYEDVIALRTASLAAQRDAYRDALHVAAQVLRDVTMERDRARAEVYRLQAVNRELRAAAAPVRSAA